MDRGMMVVDLSILRAMHTVDQEFRSIMLLARELQAGEHVIDAGTIKTLEDLIYVARSNLMGVHSRVSDRLSQYRELASAAFDAVEELRDDEAAPSPESNVVSLFQVKATGGAS